MTETVRFEAELAPILRWHFARADLGRCNRDSQLAQFAAGDLSPEERREFEAHLTHCLECTADLAEFAVLAPDSWLDSSDVWQWMRARWRKMSELGPWRLVAAGAALAIALVVVSVVVKPPERGALHVKGNKTFEFHLAAARGGRTFRVEDGARLSPGDKLGLFYSAQTDGYLFILYANEHELTRISPSSPGRAAPVAAGTEKPVTDGAMLSPEQGCEWFVGLFSSRPFDEREAAAIVQRMVSARHDCRLGPPSAPSGVNDIEVRVIGVRQ